MTRSRIRQNAGEYARILANAATYEWRRTCEAVIYIAEILKNAVYEKGEQLDVIVAEAPDLPGCLTQGATVEEARENLVDAIEVWLLSGLRSGEDPPVVNGCRLAIPAAPRRPGHAQSRPRIEA